MRSTMQLAVATVLALLALLVARPLVGQITSNPITAAIEKKGLAVEIRDLVRLPDTRGLRPLDQDVSPSGWARVSFVKDLPDGRRFANDSRGRLYLLDGSNAPRVYADVGASGGDYGPCWLFKSNYDRTGSAYWLNKYRVCIWQH